MIETADLAKISLFRDLSTEELETIRRLMFERTFRAGHTLFMEGMQGEVFYLVKSGRIDILKKRSGRDLPIASLGAGDFVGEMAIIDEEPRSATAKVAEDAELIIVTRKAFAEMMRAIPEGAAKILMAILKIVNRRLRETNRKLAET